MIILLNEDKLFFKEPLESKIGVYESKINIKPKNNNQIILIFSESSSNSEQLSFLKSEI